MIDRKLTGLEAEQVAEWWQWAMQVAQGCRHRLWMADPDDLEGWAALGLIEAVIRYDPELGGFEPYARRRIKGAVLDGYRQMHDGRRRQRVRLTSLDDMLPHVASSVDAGFDRVDDQDEAVAAATGRGLGSLSDRDRQVLVCLGSGLTIAETGARFGITGSRVSQIRCRVIRDAGGTRPTTRNMPAPVHELHCAQCGKMFVTVRPSRTRFCSQLCCARAWDARQVAS